MTFHIYPAWGCEAESETHVFFENGKQQNTQSSPLQQKHTALPFTTKTHNPPRYHAVPFEKRNVNPYATYEGESKRDWKMYSDPVMRMVLLCLCSFKQGPHLPLWKKDSKWWIPPPWSAGSARLPTLILLSLHLWNSRAARPQQGHTWVPPLSYFPVRNNMLILQKNAKHTSSVQRHCEECLMST